MEQDARGTEALAASWVDPADDPFADEMNATHSQIASTGVPACTDQPTGPPLGTGTTDELGGDPAG